MSAALALQAASVSATNPSPAPACAGSTIASSSRGVCPTADPKQSAYTQLESRLGGDLARALATERRVAANLDQLAGTELILTDEISQEEAIISSLQDKIAQLDSDISDTQARIDTEREQLAAMSRALYRQPDSFWLLIARTGNLHEALLATADAIVAGQRAHSLQTRLEADLKKLQSDRQARQDDLDRQSGTLELLNANLSSLQEVMDLQTDVSGELSDLISQIQDAKEQLRNVPPDATAALAQLLESQIQDLIQRSYETAWATAQVGVGVAMVNGQLPVGRSIQGLNLSWPMISFQITQPFGPTNVTLEPPYGPYRHFHAGVDIAAPLDTPVMASANGLVVAVGHGNYGYGNYVVIAHGGGVATLYAHLLKTTANVGDPVVRGQVIGHEGSTGFSTGPHLHFELRVNDKVVDPMPYLPVPGTGWSG